MTSIHLPQQPSTLTPADWQLAQAWLKKHPQSELEAAYTLLAGSTGFASSPIARRAAARLIAGHDQMMEEVAVRR